VILAATLALAISASSPGDSRLIGVWESRETSQGGIGGAFEFRPDGSYVDATLVIVEIPYRVDGNRLILGGDASGAGAEKNVSTFRFDGDALVQTGPDGSVVRRERLRGQKASAPTIVGEWRYCHSAGAVAYERYTDSGKLLLRIPMRSMTGRYSFEGDVLTLSRGQSPDVKLKAVVKGDSLVVSGSSGRSHELRREPAGDWYDLSRVENCVPASPPAAAQPTPRK
jgi:hypothetical protein